MPEERATGESPGSFVPGERLISPGNRGRDERQYNQEQEHIVQIPKPRDESKKKSAEDVATEALVRGVSAEEADLANAGTFPSAELTSYLLLPEY